jgi:hypothetical protein
MQSPVQTSKRPRIIFLVMSAVTPAETVDQLARALAPHTVLVHHDFSQKPDFRLESGNVLFVPDPKKTGWASFGFVEAIFHSLRYATEHLQFDYLQLLSPTCLPIRPMPEFEALARGPAEAHFGAIDMLRDPECLLGVGYRAFTPEKSLRHRVLRRLSDLHFGRTPGRRDEAGIWLRSGGSKGLRGLAARVVYRAFALPWLARHPFGADFRPHYGSVWFGAQRHIVQGMVEGFFKPGIRDYFRRIWISEEFLVPSLLMQLANSKGPLNHFINRFDNVHPRKIDQEDIEILRGSGAYFARKFPDDPLAPVRLNVLSELAGLAFASLSAPASTAAVPSRAAPVSETALQVEQGASRPAPAPALTTMALALKVARLGLHAALGSEHPSRL